MCSLFHRVVTAGQLNIDPVFGSLVNYVAKDSTFASSDLLNIVEVVVGSGFANSGG
jgi:hypothetical protein